MRKLTLQAAFCALFLLPLAARAIEISGSGNVELDNGNVAITIGSGSDSGHGHDQPVLHNGHGKADIPPGHMPARGECRIWYHGREPGQQPPPGKCKQFHGKVPAGATLIRG
jgi:hypothetical protein